MFGVALVLSGVSGSILTSFYVKKTLRYKQAMVILSSIGIAMMIIETGVLMNVDSFVPTFLGLSLVGFSTTPILPITYDLACEIAFPVGEAQITGILNSAGMIFSFFMILGSEFSIGYGSTSDSLANLVLLIVIMTVGLIFYCLLKPKLKRREAESSLNQ